MSSQTSPLTAGAPCSHAQDAVPARVTAAPHDDEPFDEADLAVVDENCRSAGRAVARRLSRAEL